jgi:hypothetical protein
MGPIAKINIARMRIREAKNSAERKVAIAVQTGETLGALLADGTISPDEHATEHLARKANAKREKR